MNFSIALTLAQGTLETLLFAGASCFFGLLVGIGLFYADHHHADWVKKGIHYFCLLIQSLPEILILFIIYFGSSVVLSRLTKGPVEMPNFLAGIITLSLIFSVYALKVFNSAMLCIPNEDIIASQQLGLSKFQTFYHILLPQLWVNSLEGLGSLWLIILKEVVLLSFIGCTDLMQRTQMLINNTHKPFTFYIITSIIYLTLTLLSEQVIQKGKKKVTKYAK